MIYKNSSNTKKSAVFLSVIVPVYNEVSLLENHIKKIIEQTEKITNDYEIIIAEDASTDGTDLISSKLSKENSNIIHLHSDVRLGRGDALNRAFKIARGDVFAYMDVDLATNLIYMSELIKKIEDGYDFSTGSRVLETNMVNRYPIRKLTSKVYNWLCRLFFGIKIYDLQCGFKAFRRKSVLDLIDEVQNKHWFWDTEIFVRGYKKGYRIAEFPVEWKESKKTKVRLHKDIMSMSFNIVKLFFKLKF